MEHASLRESFKNQLTQEFCAENLLLFDAARNFERFCQQTLDSEEISEERPEREDNAASTDALIALEALGVYRRFLSPMAIHEVRVPLENHH